MYIARLSLLGHVHALSNRADTVDELDGSSDGPSTLSYPLIRLLRACVTRFVTCLMAYAILHKDVETRQKRRIRGLFRADGVGEVGKYLFNHISSSVVPRYEQRIFVKPFCIWIETQLLNIFSRG